MHEPAGFREFVVARSPALLRMAWMLTGDAASAEDLLATALAKTWPRWHTIERPEAAETYVRRVIATTYINWWRRRWRSEVPSEMLPDRQSAPSLDSDLREDVAAALAELPRRQRAVVVLRYFADLTEAQVATELGCSVGTVKSQHAKAIAKLRLAPDDTEVTG